MARASAQQLDLLGWKPPAPVVRFAEEQIRAASLAGRVSRAVSAALKECGMERQQVARRMSDYLGEDVSLNILNAYASEARSDHVINLVRFIALLHATRDRRLLEMLAETFGWAVIERRYLPLIEVAAIREREDELRRQRDALLRQVRAGGTL